MTAKQWMLVACFSLASVFWTGESAIAETQEYTCRTFGSGVVQPFNGSAFYVRSNCPFTLSRFTHNRVECDITVRRGDSGLLAQVEIIINKVRTVLQNGSILVEKRSVSLPYDHTYQHIFQYGIYTRLKSLLLPLSVTWHDVPGGIDTLKLELEQELSTDMIGLCGKHNVSGEKQQLISESVLNEDACQIRDVVFTVNTTCRQFFSYTLDCLKAKTPHYIQLCEDNIHSYERNAYISCAFFQEIALQCGNSSYAWKIWRALTKCAPPTCPGDLVYAEEGTAFEPSCSNLNPPHQEVTSSCVCPNGKVLNDHADGFHCVMVSSCSCVFAGRSYLTGEIHSTKCQSCLCDGGKWHCSENLCPPRCVIEGQFVTTFDGKQYGVSGKCTYMASQGQNWAITVDFSQKEASLRTVTLQLFQETYTFTQNKVTFGAQEITELHQSDHALLYWCSSMFVQVHTSFGMKIQIQVSPEIQLYVTILGKQKGRISGLCGNSNNDTTDDFTTSSGIIENSAQPFSLSWSVGTCAVNIPNPCVNTDNEIFADEKCSVLNDPSGIFAECHGHIAPDQYHTACIQRTCNCGSNLQQCLCVALGSYAKACAGLGVKVGDWRKATNCTLKCPKNQEFFYDAQACNRTCRSLSGPDPCCELEYDPVEGCGCPEGTHLNQGHTCTPKAECACYHHGGITPPGPVVIDGRQCLCEDGELHCSKECGCTNGKVCVHCSEYPINTEQKTCDGLSKPLGANLTCESGCYCPHDLYEDHLGNCVSRDNCTCVYSGKVYSAAQRVETNCKTCICVQGQWHCKKEQCPGMCQVYGNGHYQTFDSKWYRFDGHCQYTLVEDYCGGTNGTFSVRVETVPCCDQALTCSRSITVDLQSKVTLTLSDMRVTKRIQTSWTEQQDPVYITHTVGLYIIISVPSSGMTLIWDKHTRITIELHANLRNKVCGLCGNFDSNEMNDLQMRGSAVVSGPLAFANSWKAGSPPCSDVTTEIFPCARNSYCSAWAQRRCMILMGDTFRDCHLKVVPEPYYHACVQESCSCEFEGKFLGFCTAVAAYAEACSDQEVCMNWRTPDLCPVYCDYYNEKGQCSWHYEACGKMLSCGKGNYLSHTLEGCYPRCPKEAPYYDENTGACTTLSHCTCYFNDTVIQSGKVVKINSFECTCENGTINCPTTTPSPTTAASTSTAATAIMTSTVSTTTETTTHSTSTPTATSSTTTSTPAATLTTTETQTPMPTSTTSTSTITATSPTTSTSSTPPTTYTTSETWPTKSITTTSTPTTTVTSTTTTSTPTATSATTETQTTMPTSTTSTSTITATSPTTSTSSTPTTPATSTATPTATSTLMTTTTTDSSTTENWTTMLSTYTTPHISVSSTSSTLSTTRVATTSSLTTNESPHTTTATTKPPPCVQCTDLKRKKSWACGETWTEDCFHKNCKNGKIEMIPVACPQSTVPTCPRGQVVKVSDGCCETWRCNCRCEVYGDPHYISFQGVPFDFFDECTYILVEEQSPRHHLTIVVDNFYCVPGLHGSCAKGIIMKYQNKTATLSIIPYLFAVQATLNNVTIQPPYEEHGLRFETTGYEVSIHLPEIRSFVSFTPSYTLVINLAMDHFVNNTQGQCGVCGGPSCIRKGGQAEDDSCCDKTAYDWVYPDNMKPACFSAPRNVSCQPPSTPSPTPPCTSNPICELLQHPVFANCSNYVNLNLKKKHCDFDSCWNSNGSCSSLEQAAEECKTAGFCIDWRRLTNGSCDVPCPEGLVYKECPNKLDDFCHGGVFYPGPRLEKNSPGCFCPHNLTRAGNHSVACVSECNYCKGPYGEPRLPGEVWQANCNICKCNDQTRTEECHPKHVIPQPCPPGYVVVNISSCGEQTCVEKTCTYDKKTYKVGNAWKDSAQPCVSFICSTEGIQTTTRVCPSEICPEEDRIWDEQQCCFTCNQSCAPRVSSINIAIDNCTSVIQMPVCQGQCVSQPWVVLHDDLQVEQECRCCREQSSERRSVTLQCLDFTTRRHTYKHITSCECRGCTILR